MPSFGFYVLKIFLGIDAKPHGSAWIFVHAADGHQNIRYSNTVAGSVGLAKRVRDCRAT